MTNIIGNMLITQSEKGYILQIYKPKMSDDREVNIEISKEIFKALEGFEILEKRTMDDVIFWNIKNEE